MDSFSLLSTSQGTSTTFFLCVFEVLFLWMRRMVGFYCSRQVFNITAVPFRAALTKDRVLVNLDSSLYVRMRPQAFHAYQSGNAG